MLGTYTILDLMLKGRNDTEPNHNMTDWVRHHDRHDSVGYAAAIGAMRARGRLGRDGFVSGRR